MKSKILCATTKTWHRQINILNIHCCCSVTKSYSILGNPMDRKMPGFPALHYLLEFAQIQVDWVIVAIQPSHPLSPPSPQALNLSPASCSFLLSPLFALGGQSIRATASVLPMNIQGWFPLGLIGLILLSKGLSRVFSSTTIWKHQFFGTQPSSSHIHTSLQEKSQFWLYCWSREPKGESGKL